jgi:ABC-type glycerol-3-phosphate transport system substrate-binding protein
MSAGLLTAGIMSSCAKAVPDATTDALVSETEVTLSENVQNIDSMVFSNGYFYFFSTKYEDVVLDRENGTYRPYVPGEFEEEGMGDAIEVRPIVAYGGGVMIEPMPALPPVVDEPADEDVIVDDTEDIAIEGSGVEKEEPVIDYVVGPEITSIMSTVIYKVGTDGQIAQQKELFKNDPFSESYTYLYYSSPNVIDGKPTFTKNMTTSGSDPVTGEYSYKDTIEIVSIDENLNETVVVDITDLTTKAGIQDYAQQYIISGDTIYISFNGTYIASFDLATGALKNKGDEMTGNKWMTGVYKLKDGSICTIFNESVQEGDNWINKSTLYKYDKATGKPDSGTKFAIGSNYNSLMQGDENYDFYYIDTVNILYGYNVGDAEPVKLIDFTASGIVANFSYVSALGDGRYAAIGYDYQTYQSKISLFTPKVDAPVRKLIKVMSFSTDYSITQFAAEFNKESEEYQVEVENYYDYNDIGVEEALTQFNSDILSGKIPDILLISSNLPYNSYASKGLFKDLNPLLEDDETLSRDMLVESVLEAMETNDKLYSLAQYFSVQSLMGKTSIFGSDPKISMEKINEISKQYPNAAVFDLTTTRDTFMSQFVINALPLYVNFETGECDFNNPDFAELLEMAKALPEEINYDELGDSYWEDSQVAYRDDKTLLMFEYTSDFTSLRRAEAANFGEAVTYLGYPTDGDKNGYIIQPITEMAIMSRAANPDGAWAFMREYILSSQEESDNSQYQYYYQFPIFKAGLDIMAEASKQKPYYIDQDGNKIEYDNRYYIGGQEIDIGVNTDADIAKVMDLINNADIIARNDLSLINIINEEADAFFAGSKTAAEASKLIQDRVQTYVNESL